MLLDQFSLLPLKVGNSSAIRSISFLITQLYNYNALKYIFFFLKSFYYPEETLAYASFHCRSSMVTSRSTGEVLLAIK